MQFNLVERKVVRIIVASTYKTWRKEGEGTRGWGWNDLDDRLQRKSRKKKFGVKRLKDPR